MHVLILSDREPPLLSALQKCADSYLVTTEKVTTELLSSTQFDFLVSYGYRHIISQEIIDAFNGQCINLHISFLPWNRGADPNLWSFLEDSPKGVTIHYIDSGIDTGDIIVQAPSVFGNDETLASTYEKLHLQIQQLFSENWPLMRESKSPRQSQVGVGSFHKMKDKVPYEHLLKSGWQTPVSTLVGKALINHRETK